ncbi:MAG: DUF2341 domain-containing protein [Ignavibacteria bacterium]|nr:DUF2341 domain-containing protein [Ignavibacteria bacterium]
MKRILTIIVLMLLALAGTEIQAQPCNCLTGWSYRSPMVVSNTNATPYNFFEIKDTINTLALVTAGKMKADGGDLRFTDSLCNPLPYWVESGINTATTIIWFRVYNIPAGASRTVYMYYGNPSATSTGNPKSVFKFYEGFDGSGLEQFAQPCGNAGGVTVSGGNLSLSWSSDKVILSDTIFPRNEIYTAEMNVVASTGNWPALLWVKNDANQRSYGVLLQNSTNTVRIGKSGSGVGACQGQNFTVQASITSPVGLWTTTWVATADIRATFPGVAPLQTGDSEHARDTSFKIGIGGIASGSGTITVDWVRARRWSPVTITGELNTAQELSVPKSPAGPSVTVLGSSSLRVNWVDSSSNEDKFMIERSTNGGSNWILRDSVAAGVVQYTDNGLTQNTQYCYRVYAKNCIGASAPTTQVCGTTTFVGVSQTGAEIPKVFSLYQNYPNPFNPVTNIRFDIPKESSVKITIFDALGRVVKDIVNQRMQPGSYSVDWNASSYSSGIYFYRIQAGDYVNEMKMVLVK